MTRSKNGPCKNYLLAMLIFLFRLFGKKTTPKTKSFWGCCYNFFCFLFYKCFYHSVIIIRTYLKKILPRR